VLKWETFNIKVSAYKRLKTRIVCHQLNFKLYLQATLPNLTSKRERVGLDTEDEMDVPVLSIEGMTCHSTSG
jgi:hypothetical protein